MSIFEFVKSKISILELVQEYVRLKRAGGYHKGSCPFHSETDASFTVSPDKGIFYCFGCHSGGDIIAFTAKAESLSQLEAAQFLVDKFNLEIPESVKKEFSQISGRSSQKDQFFHTCKSVRDWTHKHLKKSSLAKTYIQNRKISDYARDYFEIGYLPGGIRQMDFFLKDMAKQNILLSDLTDAGIVMQGQHSIYSPFEERILFPIHNAMGRCCGFGGRIFHENDQRAKYYNSKESPWFSKGKLLFALDLAKKEMQFSEKAFLVEGYTDCVAMAQHGYKNTVATLGTACSFDHLKQIARFVKTLYVLYDGDAAGQKAILRLTELCWQTNLELQIIKFPTKDDPASFLEKEGDLKELINQSTNIFNFFVDSLGKQFWTKHLSEKMNLCDRLVKVIANINNTLKQDLLLQQAAASMQIPLASLQALLRKNSGKQPRWASNDSLGTQSVEIQPVAENPSNNSMLQDIPIIEEKIFAIIIKSIDSEKPLFVSDDLLPYFSKPMQNLFSGISKFFKEKSTTKTTFDKLLHAHSKEEQNWILQASLKFDDAESPEKVLEKLGFQFRKQNWKQMVQDIKQRIFDAKQKNDTEKLNNLLLTFIKLKQELKFRGLL